MTREQKLQTNGKFTSVIDPVTGKVRTRRARSRSFKRFYRDVDEVLKGSMTYESCFDLLSVIAELDVRVSCIIGDTGVRSYNITTMDGRFSMGNISFVRTLLIFVQKTVPIPGVYTERQIKRIKSIIRMNTEMKRINKEWALKQKVIAGELNIRNGEIVKDDEIE